MKLGAALSFRVVAIALPLVVLSAFGVARIATERARDRMAAHVLARLDDLGPERCIEGFAREPRLRARGPRGQRVMVYDAALVPRSPGAEPLPEALVRAAEAGEAVAGTSGGDGGPPHETLFVRTAFPGTACAYVALHRRIEPPERFLGALVPAVVVGALFSLAVAIASGGLVRRIVRLAAGVRSGDAATLVDDGGDELADLARALRDREARLSEQLDALEARERALREYIANTTHDVLVPLTVLAGEIDGIANAVDRGEAPAPESVRIALEETHYVGALLHNLNARARLEGGLVTRTSVPLGPLVERVVARHRVIAERRSVSIDHAIPEDDVRVEGDPTLLEQAVSNVVHNAVRHNRTGGHVAVVLAASPGRFSLTVADDGDGVPAELFSRLGERGLRTSEARSRTPDGTGLGLHIVREVAALHGLSLAFSPSDPSGLTVRLEGPLALSEAAARPR